MATPILNQRALAEEIGRAFLNTLMTVSEANVSNPIVLGTSLIAEMKARGVTPVTTLPFHVRPELRMAT